MDPPPLPYKENQDLGSPSRVFQGFGRFVESGPTGRGVGGKVNLPPIHVLTRPTDGSADSLRSAFLAVLEPVFFR